MTECIQHPDDPTRWLPVDEALLALWKGAASTLALAQAAAPQSALDALTDRVAKVEELTARVDALTTEVATLTTNGAALRSDLDALKARVDALPKPLPTGPASGVDVSGNQTQAAVDAAAADPANLFGIVKATEGQTTTFASYGPQTGSFRKAGKLVGAYHFAWANQDPVKEAANFLAFAKPQPGDFLVLDLEDWGTGPKPTPEMQATPWTQRVAYAIAWLQKVRSDSRAQPLIYLNWSWIKGLRTAATADQWKTLTSFPLWLADPSGVPGQHSTVNSQDGTNPDCWPIHVHQYAVNTLDRDYTPDIAKLRTFAVPA